MIRVKLLTGKTVMSKRCAAVLGIALFGLAQGTAAQGPWEIGNHSHVTASLDGGTLTISGTGVMKHYNSHSGAPWVSDSTVRNTITSVVIESGVTSIGNRVFYGLGALTSVTMPESIDSIGYEAFYACSSLTSVTIGNGVTSIGMRAFMDCKNLTSVTIPYGLTSIGDAAFSNCYKLTDINLPNSVTSIGTYAFSDCRAMTSITIPESVTFIQPAIFYGCSSLTSITIPNSVTAIGPVVFSNNNSLTSITIPSSVDSIGDMIFNGCSNLTSIISLNPVPPLLYAYHGGYYFNGVDKAACTLYVPNGSVDAYRAADEWGQFVYIKSAFTVTFLDSQEGSVVSSQIVGEGNRVTKPADLGLLDGYTFGWHRTAPCNNGYVLPCAQDNPLWDFDTDIVTSDITLFAKWTQSVSVLTSPLTRANSSLPAVSVRGRTLSVKLPSSLQSATLQIRVVDMRGRTVSNFNTVNGTDNSFSLTKIPAGRYIVEVRNTGKRMSSTPVMLR
ncbi:MAG: leucine-rich repeat protein [Chitinispirillales bacterium]|nr:leucine-rich repeat protein [Chitinispirillales bacterium]